MTVLQESDTVAGLERPGATEAADIDEIVRGMLAIQARAAAAGERPLSRGTHAKGICVRAEFEVFDLGLTVGDPALAARLAKGVFARPGIYHATVRFANADGGHRPDKIRDVRAMSFSIEVPQGVIPNVSRLDFSMNSWTTFPINDAHAFAVAVRVLSAQGRRGKLQALRSLSWSEVGSLLRTMWLGRQQQRGTPQLPYQQLRFWSTVPFLHGDRDAVKYSAIPADNSARGLQNGPNRLHEELVRHVNEDERMSQFTFALQLLDPVRMTHKGRNREPEFWIENAAVEWRETEAPFHVVGRLKLTPKSVLAPAEAEAFSIDVTENTTPETRPIGSINRARWRAEAGSRKARLAQPVVASPWTPVPRGKRIFWAAAAVSIVAFAAAFGWALGPVAKDLPAHVSGAQAPLGSNGLTAEERQQYYHLSEGGEAFPIAWLLALEQEIKDEKDKVIGYRPFLENIERFGLIPDPTSRYNPYGLPVGVTAGYGKITGQQMMGLNCTACHVGELHYNRRAFRMDGGPSGAYINAFVKAIVDETSATAHNRERLSRFVDRWRRVKLVRLENFPVVQAAGVAPAVPGLDEETLDRAEPGALWRVAAGLRMALKNRSLLMDKLHGFRAMKMVVQAQPLGTVDGYGRNDAFGVGRNELFGAYKDASFSEGINTLPADAPVSFPHLWGMAHTSWFQWGANTNSVIERNIGQALGVGATYQPDQNFSSTVRLDNLHAMEELQYKLTAPQWPAELLGPIDPDKAARGRAIFDRTCAMCHETYTKNGTVNEYQLFALDVVGTDPGTAVNFERLVMTKDGPRPFGSAAFDVVKQVKAAYYRENGIPAHVQAEWEAQGVRPAAEYRTPLRDYQKYYDTRHRGVYRAKTLKGIWATAPFLHNGSVPSLFDLLLPAEQRPVRFKMGTKEFDPVKLGFVVDGPRFLVPEGAPAFEFDTSLLGNWNTGHEWWFYDELDDTQRYEIIEFLKTFDDANYPGDYKFTPPAKLPEEIRMKQKLTIPAPGPASPARPAGPPSAGPR